MDNSGEATDSASGLHQNPLEVQSPFLVRVYHHPTFREMFHDFSWFFYPFLCARSWIFRCIFDAYDVCKMHYVDIVESETRYCNPTHLHPTFHQNMFNQNPSSYLTKLPFLPTRTVSANLISRIVESDRSELLPLLPFWDTIHHLDVHL